MKRINATLIGLLAIAPAMAQREQPDSITPLHLDEVVVKGSKPQIKAADGVMIIDLPAIVSDKPVTNILEALGYLPGVVYDNGTIGLNGASSVTIVLNGEPTTMPLQNLYQLLYSMPVERVKNVEIMYSAPAKYHANGAVINIVMKKPRPLDGLMGQATLGYDQARYATYHGGVNATYAINDLSFDINWSISRNHSYSQQETLSNHLINGSRHIVHDDMRQIGKNLSNIVYAAAAYKNLKLSYNTQITSDTRNRSLSTGTFGNYSNLYKAISPASYHNISIRYVAPSGITAGAEYTNYNEHRIQNLFKDYDKQICSENKQSINRYHAYIDCEHDFNSWTLGYGADYQHADDKSSQSYILPPQQGFDNLLTEDVASAYAGAKTSFKCGLSLNASVEAEYFHNNYRHNWNIIPQLGATFYKTPQSIFQLNFTSDRVYPSFWQLHGGTAYVNDYTTILGNPELQPYINYTGQLSYIFRQKFAATLYMLYADDYSVQLPYQATDHLRLIFQTLNMDFSKTTGIQINAPFEVTNFWNIIATLNISHAQQKSSRFHDLSFNNKRWGIYARLNNTVRFTKECPISLSIDGTYTAGQIQGAGRFAPLWKIDAGVKWQFGMKRCCELNIKANDIFNTFNPNLRIKFASQDYSMQTSGMNRNIHLAFVYRFNGFKPKDNSEIDTSRFGTDR